MQALVTFVVLVFHFSINTESYKFNSYNKIATFGKKVYSFYSDSFCAYEKAGSTCKSTGGQVVHIKSKNVNDFILKQIEEYKSNVGGMFNDGFWLALKQIGNDYTKYKWEDGTLLKYSYWLHNQPNKAEQPCVSILIKIQENAFGFWADRPCDVKCNPICENDFGSGFLSSTTVVVKNLLKTVNCTVIGDREYKVTWIREGVAVSSSISERVYQKFTTYKDFFKTATIKFVEPFNYDEGTYTCRLMHKDTHLLQELDLTVTTVPFGDLSSSPKSELKLAHSNKVSCTIRSRPISTLLWKVNGRTLLKDPDVFSILSETTGLFTNSTFVIINPISFQANAGITCVVNGKPLKKSININSDFVKVDKSQYKFDFSNTLDGTLGTCGKYSGAKAAEIQTLPIQQNQCIGKEISFNIIDHTKSSPEFKLVVTLVSSSSWSETIYTKSTQINLTKLEPNKDYQIKMSYKPKYWTDSVELIKQFQTKSTLFESMEITEAILKEDFCEVKFKLAENTLENQITLILVKISEKNISSTLIKRINKKYIYADNNETFKFATNGDSFEYTFRASLLSCSGISGKESKRFTCTKNPGVRRTGLFYLLLILIIPMILLLIRRFILDHLKKKHESKEVETIKDVVKPSNVDLSSVDDKKVRKNKKKRKKKHNYKEGGKNTTKV